MSKDQQGNILKYCSNNCVLVINKQGKIRQVFTPFLVTAIIPNGGRKRTFVVEEVATTTKDELIYVINGKKYHYAQFTIAINF